MKFDLLPLIIAFLFQSFTLLAQGSEKAKDTAIKPYFFATRYNSVWGHIGNKIYKQKTSGGKWKYIGTLPFATGSGFLTVKNRHTIEYIREEDSIFYYRFSDAKLDRKSHREFFDSFCANSIKKIIFSRVSLTHRDRDADSMVYELKEGQFVLAYKSPPSTRHRPYLSDNSVTIDPSVVEGFVRKLPVIYNKKTAIDGLGFTPEDYDSCRRNILTYKTYEESPESECGSIEKCAFTCYGNNINFEKMLALVDSVRTMDPKVLYEYFYYALESYDKEPWPETVPKVEFVNTKNEVLEIKSTYEIPWTLDFPWDIKLNGFYFLNTAIEINDFLDSVFPQFLDPRQRVKLIQELVLDLYYKWRRAQKK